MPDLDTIEATEPGDTLHERLKARPDSIPAPGQMLGRYIVIGILGRGGMGTVLKAYDEALDRPVALKLLHGGTSDHHTQRLKREAQALAKLSHPNVVQVYEVGEAGNQWFIAMELVNGQTLREWQEADRRWQARVNVYLEVGRGLAAAHAAGLVHRDFKPDNCIIDEQGRPRVLDFGLVRETDSASEAEDRGGEAAAPELDTPRGSLTQTGAVLGTVTYMPLEQLSGRAADARSDQFSFCVALYEALYGERPFPSESVGQLTKALMFGEIRTPPRGTLVPAKLRRVLDLRMGCLRRRRIEFQDAVELLAEANEVRVSKAVNLVSGLPGFARCDDIDALRAELAPPEDPQVAEQVEQARTQLTHAHSLHKANELEAAFSHAEAVVERAQALHYPPLIAEAWARRGAIEEQRGHYEDAERDLEQAYMLAAEHDHYEVEAMAAAELVLVAGQRRAQPERGLWWGMAALALSKRFRDNPLAEAGALDNIGIVLKVQGKLDEALDHHERALVIKERILSADNPALANSLNSIGNVHYERGAPKDALSHYQRGLAIRENALGARHPSVASSLNNIGNVLTDQGQFEEALTYYRRALEIREDALGPNHSDVATVLHNIGNDFTHQGRFEEALAHHRRALAIKEETLGPEHIQVASLLNSIANVLREQGQIEQALIRYRRMLAIMETTLGPKHAYVAGALYNIGKVLEDRGEFDLALARHRRALAIREEAMGPQHAQVADSLYNIGNILRLQGEFDEAEAHYRHALAILEQVPSTLQLHIAHPLIGLAETALARHDVEIARDYARQALSICEADEVSPDLLAGVRFVVAQSSWSRPANRAHAHARTLAQRAHDAYEELGDGRRDERAEIATWLENHPAHASDRSR